MQNVIITIETEVVLGKKWVYGFINLTIACIKISYVALELCS
jgi:hypothetical protein